MPLARRQYAPRRSSFTTGAAIGAICLLGGAAAVCAASKLSPWPAALLIRALFDADAKRTVEEMSPYEPAGGVRQTLDVSYGGDGRDTSLDVFAPEATAVPHPAIVWIHGGAWISGSKEHVRPYARMLAARGYVSIAVNYAVAPERQYPTALAQLNEALAFIVSHAEEFGIDPTRIVIAGDSAGANLASQLAVLTTSRTYAEEVGLQATIPAAHLRGVVLNCGIYDVSGIPALPGIKGWGFRKALQAYLGGRDWSRSRGDEQMSTIDWVTKNFPATWVSGGNGDPLTKKQSARLAAHLAKLGVDVTTVFYADEHEPALPHEYQFHFDFPEARAALESTVRFLDRVTGPEGSARG